MKEHVYMRSQVAKLGPHGKERKTRLSAYLSGESCNYVHNCMNRKLRLACAYLH